MAEKSDDNASSPASSAAVVQGTPPAVIDRPPKSTDAFNITDPLPRPMPPNQHPPQPQPTTTSALPDAPPAKEGFNYWKHLPYAVEDDATRIAHLNEIVADLYTFIRAGDLESGARTASRRIKRWLHLKFKMPKETRKALIRLYYQLSLTPGIDPSAADAFANMFKLLAL